MESKECHICGKTFIKPQATLYKLKVAGKTVYCCSYTCHNKAVAIQDAGKIKRSGFKIN